MAKLVVTMLLAYFLASALTSCSAARPLPTEVALSTDESHSTTVTSKSSVFSSASATPAMESGVVSEEEVRSEDSAVNIPAPPCMEEDLEDSNVDGKKPCHRWEGDGMSFAMLDYGGMGSTNPNPKGP
ncbi:unnamed protein product [Calypogeia fissa]